MSSRILPPELWIHVIDELGSTRYSGAYQLPEGSYDALFQLCLVNWAMKSLTEPVLYSIYYVETQHLDCLSQTVCVEEGAEAAGEGSQLRAGSTSKASMM